MDAGQTTGLRQFFAEDARVGRSAIDVVGTVSHGGDQPVRRSIVVGTTLYTLSEAGLKGSSLTSLAPRSWVTF